MTDLEDRIFRARKNKEKKQLELKQAEKKLEELRNMLPKQKPPSMNYTSELVMEYHNLSKQYEGRNKCYDNLMNGGQYTSECQNQMMGFWRGVFDMFHSSGIPSDAFKEIRKEHSIYKKYVCEKHYNHGCTCDFSNFMN